MMEGVVALMLMVNHTTMAMANRTSVNKTSVSQNENQKLPLYDEDGNLLEEDFPDDEVNDRYFEDGIKEED